MFTRVIACAALVLVAGGCGGTSQSTQQIQPDLPLATPQISLTDLSRQLAALSSAVGEGQGTGSPGLPTGLYSRLDDVQQEMDGLQQKLDQLDRDVASQGRQLSSLCTAMHTFC